jgi:hypothetical protein
MKVDFRVGTALAAVVISASCSQPPAAPTAPSATAETVSAATAADGSTLKMGSPALVSPVESERVNDRRPMLIWANAIPKYGSFNTEYDIEVSSPTGVVYEITVGQAENFGAHILPFELEYDITYSWRVRARSGNDFGPWSASAEFKSPQRPGPVVPIGIGGTATCAAPLSPVGPGETRKPRPNDSAIVAGVAAAFPGALIGSCQSHGGSWEFMDRAIDALRSKDGRYGYNAKRGNMNDPSHDVASYFYRPETDVDINNRHEVYIFDLIGGHCGPTPFTVWLDVTDATHQGGTIGRTMYPRPGRNVAAVSCATAGQ